MILLLLACGGEGSPTRREAPSEPEVVETTAFSLSSAALPFATAGETPPTATVELRGAAGLPLRVDVTGDFAITGDTGPLGAGEVRVWTVAYTGPIDAPVLAAGTLTVTAGTDVRSATLAAVLGDPALPTVAWETDAWGTHGTAPFPSAPYPDGDASVWISVPPGFSDADAIAVATHLHGHYAVLAETIPAQQLVPLHAMSGRDAVFVAPQGPVDEASGDFGALEDPGGHERLIRDVVSVLYRDGMVTHAALGAQLVSSHSGGYGATASVLDHGGLPVEAVLLYDSLYGYADDFEAYARDGGVLFSNWTDWGGTSGQNLALADDLLELDPIGDFRADHLLDAQVAIGRTASAHGACMTDGLTHARWLAASPLPPSPLAAPEILTALVSGGTATVAWRGDRVDRTAPVIVEGSADGVTWAEIGRSDAGSVEIPATPWIRLAPDGDRWAAAGSAWLVVDGFDRVFGGSWSAPSHDFAARVGAAFGGASTASNEAVAEGRVDLGGYDGVVWLLGDEGLADVTFDADEQAALGAYVAGGGALVLSGAEVGFATDDAFLASLGLAFVADDAGTDVANGWTFGKAYPEDYPDILAGDEILWTYATGGGAAVRTDRVIAVGFPLETLDDGDLAAAAAALAEASR